MARDVLQIAQGMLRRRKFSAAIRLLEGRNEIYEGNFEYYILLATACLYVGDAGTASTYYQRARDIKLTDTTLLLGQAALFLRRGDTDRAIQYYLEVLDNDPQNKLAKEALEFIRTKGDYSTICRWVDSGKIERFYPPVGINPDKVWGVILSAAAGALCVMLVLHVVQMRKPAGAGPRADLSSFELSSDESKNAQEKDMSSGVYKYILSGKEITDSYEKAQRYFQSYRDNAAQIEINRLLNSNAVPSIKQKARLLMSYLSVPTFDTITDSPAYESVAKDPGLYMDCFVVWSGRVSNAEMKGASYRCDLLVGYETMKKVSGIVPLKFASNPGIANDKPVKILGKITTEDGKICIEGNAVYQSVNNFLEKP
jgi:tetratricopeptide (TPR) repeat protein